MSARDKARLQVIKSYHLGRELDLRAAVSSGVAALPVITRSEDVLWMCRAHGRVAAAVHSLGDFGAALRHYQAQIRLASEQLSSAGLTAVDQDRYTEELFCGRHNLAHQFFRLGELQQSHQCYKSCYALVRDNEVGLGYLLVNHSQCFIGRGYLRKAETQAKAALEIGRRLGVARIVVYALPVLAQLAGLGKDADAAERFLQEGIRAAGTGGLYRSHIQLKLAQHYFDSDEPLRSAEVLENMDEVTDAVDEAQYFLLQSNLAERMEKFSLALAHHKQHLAVKERIFITHKENQAWAAEVAGQLRELEEVNRRLSERNLKLAQSVEQIGRDHNRLQTLARRDPLTDLYNRRHFMEIAESCLRQAKNTGSKVSLAIIDIDLFKTVNDTHGHDTGDRVLQKLAWLLKDHLRQNDTLARFGGEEFVALLPGTGVRPAVYVMQSLIARCEHYPWHELSSGLSVTCSAGVAQAGADYSFAELFKQADLALYRAKNSGRNRVESGMSAESVGYAPLARGSRENG